jgi:hypothetical protein
VPPTIAGGKVFHAIFGDHDTGYRWFGGLGKSSGSIVIYGIHAPPFRPSPNETPGLGKPPATTLTRSQLTSVCPRVGHVSARRASTDFGGGSDDAKEDVNCQSRSLCGCARAACQLMFLPRIEDSPFVVLGARPYPVDGLSGRDGDFCSTYSHRQDFCGPAEATFSRRSPQKSLVRYAARNENFVLVVFASSFVAIARGRLLASGS